MRALAREQRIGINNEARYINEVFYDQVKGDFISNQSEIDLLQIDRDTLDQIGVTKTVDLLVGMFNEIAGAYFARWSKHKKPRHEVFIALLEPIRLRAIKEPRGTPKSGQCGTPQNRPIETAGH